MSHFTFISIAALTVGFLYERRSFKKFKFVWRFVCGMRSGCGRV